METDKPLFAVGTRVQQSGGSIRTRYGRIVSADATTFKVQWGGNDGGPEAREYDATFLSDDAPFPITLDQRYTPTP